jgi:hypothetical protein
MATEASGGFKVDSWDEEAYDELDDGVKLTRASVKQTFTGDLDGTGTTEWLMCGRADGTANFVGLVSVSGRLGDRDGSFVLENRGTFDGQVAAGPWSVVPGSGTGALAGLRGDGSFSAPFGSEATLTLAYDFE